MRSVVLGLFVAAGLSLGWLAERPTWILRAQLRRELRELARFRRSTRQTAMRIEYDLRARELSALDRDQLGRELAACAVFLCSIDERIDATLDELHQLTR